MTITEFITANLDRIERERCNGRASRAAEARRWVAAIRAVVGMHVDGDLCVGNSGEVCEACHYGVSPCHGGILRAVAGIFADRPGYDPAWAA